MPCKLEVHPGKLPLIVPTDFCVHDAEAMVEDLQGPLGDVVFLIQILNATGVVQMAEQSGDGYIFGLLSHPLGCISRLPLLLDSDSGQRCYTVGHSEVDNFRIGLSWSNSRGHLDRG